ncbi:MAG: hypothetical protein HKP30_05850 [Myxococcales bacterium]|nr:hypothetical protein [Myxococcales bacterium]
MKQSLAARMWNASLLHADTFEEVEADESSIRQATFVVLLTAAAGGGGSFWLHAIQRDIPMELAILPIALEILEPLVLWLGSSFFSYTVGATFFRGPHTETDFPEVLRTVGFAFAPGVLRIFGYGLPALLAVFGLGGTEVPRILFNLAIELWVLVAGIVAIRQALDFTTGRAVGTFGAAYLLLYLVVMGLSTALA